MSAKICPNCGLSDTVLETKWGLLCFACGYTSYQKKDLEIGDKMSSRDNVDLKHVANLISMMPKENNWTKEKLVEFGLSDEMQRLAELTGLMSYWEKSSGMYLLDPKKAKEITSVLK